MELEKKEPSNICYDWERIIAEHRKYEEKRSVEKEKKLQKRKEKVGSEYSCQCFYKWDFYIFYIITSNFLQLVADLANVRIMGLH